MRILSEKEWRAEQRQGQFFGPPSAISPYHAGRLAHMLGDPRDANPCDPAGPWWPRWDDGWHDRDAGIEAPPPPERPALPPPEPPVTAAAHPRQLTLDL